MADNQLRSLERDHLTNPTMESLKQLLITKQRLGQLKLSRNVLNLLANCGIEPIVACYFSGPSPGQSEFSYRCRDKNCWNAFPHQHSNGALAVPFRRESKIGWAPYLYGDLGRLGSRIGKAGWAPSIIIAGALARFLNLTDDVKKILGEAKEIVVSGSNTDIERIKGIAREQQTEWRSTNDFCTLNLIGASVRSATKGRCLRHILSSWYSSNSYGFALGIIRKSLFKYYTGLELIE